jgi:hypothetical protein
MTECSGNKGHENGLSLTEYELSSSTDVVVSSERTVHIVDLRSANPDKTGWEQLLATSVRRSGPEQDDQTLGETFVIFCKCCRPHRKRTLDRQPIDVPLRLTKLPETALLQQAITSSSCCE